jgi:ATP-dependent Lon protease
MTETHASMSDERPDDERPDPAPATDANATEQSTTAQDAEPTPILAAEHFVLFPFMIAPLLVNDPKAIQLIDDVVTRSRTLALFTPRAHVRAGDDERRVSVSADENGRPFFDRIHRVGCVAMILRMLKMPDGSLRLLVHGVQRARLVEPMGEEPYPLARLELIEEEIDYDAETEALKKTSREMLAKLVELSDSLGNDLVVAANNADNPGRLADLIASSLSLGLAEQQAVLELANVKRRLMRVQKVLGRELEVARIGSRIQNQVKNTLDRHQRDFFLREQLKAIRHELGEDADGGDEMEDLAKQLRAAKMPDHARKVAQKELSRLRGMSPSSPEHGVSRAYLDCLVSLPWSRHTRDNIDLKKAQKILDRDHYDLEKIKERILEYLAVIKLRRAIRGPILCLVGPPGVGKTSLGRSIAASMGRKFARMSLGGTRDEAEIRGHRRTYIGSMPGRVIKSIKDAGANNPVLMLDEIDKMGSDFRGDPASALLEVLDPEQNAHFVDHYVDLPFDLSQVMFITTANTLETIPGPLLDRMEIVRLAGYTLREKLEIARRYLVPRALENCGLGQQQVAWEDAAIEKIVEAYTREAGLRSLERQITSVCRKIARRQAEQSDKAKHKSKKTGAGSGSKTGLGASRVTPELVREFLGPESFDRDDLSDRAGQPGVAVGLAWTPTGGDILFIEATATPATAPGPGRLTLTGQLGDVMKESAQAARTCLLADARRLGLAASAFDKKDLHVHVPAGAIPKDGPSAGIALLTAMASLLVDRPIRPRLAMTGEITLKGNVLPVGGIKEKVLAAHRSGIRTLILPKRNEKDMEDVPEEVRRDLTIHYVDRAEEVLRLALPKPAPKKRATPPKPAASKKRAQAAASKGRAPAPRKQAAKRPAAAPATRKRPAAPQATRKKASRRA